MDKEKLTEELNKLLDGLNGLDRSMKAVLSQVNDPSIVMQMNDKEREFLDQAKTALNFEGLTPKEMKGKLDNILENFSVKRWD